MGKKEEKKDWKQGNIKRGEGKVKIKEDEKLESGTVMKNLQLNNERIVLNQTRNTKIYKMTTKVKK